MKRLKDLPLDKRRHLLIGLLVSWIGGIAAFVIWERFMIIGAIVSVFAASVVWEWIHLYRSRFSWEDVKYGMYGSIPVVIFWILVMLFLDYKL